MKKLLLSLTLLTFFASTIWSQEFDLCTDALMSPNMSVTLPWTQTDGNSIYGDEGDWTTTTIPGPLASGYTGFSVASSGFYNLDVSTGGGTPTTGTSVIAISEDCTILESEEIWDGVLLNGINTTIPCIFLTGGTTYVLAHATTTGQGGNFNFTLSSATLVTNDNCAIGNPSVVAGANAATNACSDGLVWYQYTVTDGDDIDITVTGGTLTTPSVGQVLLNGCGGMDVGPNPTCLTPGNILYIEVGDGTPNYGDFSVNISDVSNAVANDDCVNATPATATPVVTCTTNTWSAQTNVNACPEATDYGLCGIFNTQAAVWYTFTTDATANNVDIALTTTSGGPYAFALLQDIGGGCVGPTQIIGCNTTGSALAQAVLPNTQYYLVVANTLVGLEGTFNLSVSVNSLVANEDPCTAIPLMNAIPQAGSTLCALNEVDIAVCTNDENQVWFTYMTPATGTNGFTVTTTNVSATGPYSVGIYTMSNCATLAGLSLIQNAECNAGVVAVDVNCTIDGQLYYIAVGTTDATAGNFNIQVDDILDTSCHANDECIDAIDINSEPGFNPAITCVYQTVGTYCNLGACPDQVFTACLFELFPTVWFEVTAPAAATEISVQVNGSTLTNPTVGIFNDNSCVGAFTEVTPGSGCGQGGNPAMVEDISITGGMTYLIAVGSQSAIGGTFDLNIKFDVLVSNDDCINADMIISGVPFPGTTACATPEMPAITTMACLPADQTNTVFYEFTIPPGNKGMDITITGTGLTPIMGNINVAIFETTSAACVADGTTLQDTDCLMSGVTSQQFNCLGAGTYIIRVATSDMNAGDFNILATLIPLDATCGMNDNCSDATPIANTVTCIPEMLAADCNVNTCPEDFTTAGCNYGVEEVVWYELTIPVGATTIEVQLRNYTAAGTPFFGVFNVNGCVGLPVVLDNNGGCNTGVVMVYDNINVSAFQGSTVHIAVGSSSDAGGNFELWVQTNIPPANDDPCAASIDIPTLLNATTLGTTNLCATDESPLINPINCNAVDQEATVFYQYTVGPGEKGFIVNVTGTGGTPITGTANVAIFENTACNMTMPTEDDVCVMVPGDAEFDCLDEGTTYYIMVASSEMNSGDFDLTLTAIMVDPICGVNDECSMATMVANTNTCELENLGNYCNTNTCPEDFSFGACAYDQEEVVWFELSIPAGASTIEVQIQGYSGSGTVFWGVFDVNGCVGVPIAIDGNSCNLGGALVQDIDVSAIGDLPGGGTVHIAVGSSGDDGGNFNLFVQTNVPPANDDPCAPAIDIPTLISTVTLPTTNLCASDETPLINPINCNAVNQEATVFYQYTVGPGEKGFIVNINPAAPSPMMGTANVAIFENTACNMTTPSEDDVCVMVPGDAEFDCLDEGTTYYIMVASSDVNSGDFDLTLTAILEDPVCGANDECADATMVQNIMNCTLENLGNYCNANTCPEDFSFGACMYDQQEVVWFELQLPDVNTSSIDVQIQNYMGTGSPFFGVFSTDCINPPTVLDNSGGCNQGQSIFENIDVSAQAGSSVYIAVGSSGDDGGSFDLFVSTNIAPDNDECVDGMGVIQAEPLTPGVTLVMETTSCAAPDFTFSCPANQESAVWYTYTVPAGVAEITIDITNFTPLNPGGVDQLSILAFDGPCGNNVLVNTDDPFYCGPSGLEILEISLCELNPNDVINFQVSTSEMNEANFDITLNEFSPSPGCSTNDDCVMATDAGVIPASEDCDTPLNPLIQGCNEYACPDIEVDNACLTGIDNVVWHTITVDPALNPVEGGFLNISIPEDGGAPLLWDPVIAVFSGACGALVPFGNCEIGSGGVVSFGPEQVFPGQIYYIAVGNNTTASNGGTYDMCVEITEGCVNDDPCDAATLVNGVPTINPASTVNCNPDIADNTCPEVYEATVWYTFEVPLGFAGFEVTITNFSVTGFIGMQIGEYNPANCANPAPPDYTDCRADLTMTHIITCTPEGGEFYIQIGSGTDMDAGDFEIVVNALTPAQLVPPAPTNDLCSTAEDIPVSVFCDYIPVVGTTQNACEELFNFGTCNFDQNEAVWYQVTIPNDPLIYGLDVLLAPQTLGGAVFGVYEIDCNDPLNTITPQVTDMGVTTDCVNMAEIINIQVTPGNTYHILVSSSTGSPGTFELSIKVKLPPPNNDCDMAEVLTIPGGAAGTTKCANWEGTEWSNCTQDLNPSDVWYAIPVDPSFDAISINITGWTGNGNYGAEMLGSGGDCTSLFAFFPAENLCDNQDKEFKVNLSCLDVSVTHIYIRIGSNDDPMAQGDFNISVNPLTLCDYADNCEDITTAQQLGDVNNPLMTDPSFQQIFQQCIPGCLDLACPDTPPGADCGFSQSPTVWIQIETDDIAAQLFTSVTTTGTWDPVWSIYSGDCANLTQIASATTPPCSNGDVTPDLHQTAIEEDATTGDPITTYYVAITADPAGPPIDIPTFEICAYTTINALVCLGDINDNCNPDPSLVLEAFDEDGNLTNGPFCPGQEIMISLSFFYDATESGADWFHGLVPNFGPGWDMENFDFAAAVPQAEWFDEDGGCAPTIEETVPHLCTYIDADGEFRLCNSLCESCPCTPGIMEGDPIPSGWFWISNGGSAGCLNDCSPGEAWGIGSTTSQINIMLNLTVKEFENENECLMNNDLQISFQTFSDGVAGCWEDPVGECLIDRKQFGPLWEVECNVPPAVLADDEEICNNGTTNILVTNEDGNANVEIVIEVIDNPNVDGEMNHNFIGSDVIMDNLTNLTNVTQIVVYEMYTVIPGLVCDGPVTEVMVTIYPELEVMFPPNQYVCEGACTFLTPGISGGTGNYVLYEWSNGAATPTIEVCPLVPTTYTITVTDDLGCTGTGEVEVDVKPPMEFTLPTEISVCKVEDGMNDPSYTVVLEVTSGSPTFQVSWMPQGMLAGTVSGTVFNGDTYIIDEENSGYTTFGPHILCATVTDFFGCSSQECMDVFINSAPIVQIAPTAPIQCGDTEVVLNAIGISPTNAVVNQFDLYNCDGVFIESQFSEQGFVMFSSQDLLANDCFEVVATDENGCSGSEQLQLMVSMGTPVQLMGDSTICIGDGATVMVVNDTDYTTFDWDNGLMTPTIMVSPDTTTTYIVTVTDANGCSSVDQFKVTVEDLPVLSLSGSLSYCAGSATTLTASGGTSYEWEDSGGSSISSMASVVISSPGDYTVFVTDVNGCVSDSTVTVIEDTNLNVTLPQFNLCDNSPDTLSAGGGFDTYMWEDGSGTPLGDTTFIVVSSAGTYNLTVSDVTGCTGEASVMIGNNNTPTAMVTDSIEVCRVDNGIGNICIDFTAQVNTTGSWEMTDVVPGLMWPPADITMVCFDGAPRDTFTFTFTTNSAVAPCDDASYPMEVIVRNCDCPSVALSGPVTLCNDSGTTYDVQNFELTNEPGSWAFLSSDNGETATLDGDTLLTTDGMLAGNYTFQFCLDNPVGGMCPDCNEAVVEILEEPFADILTDATACNEDTGNGPTVIDLDDSLDPASDPGTWMQTGGPSVTINADGTTDFAGITPMTVLTFEYTTNNAVSPCDDVSTILSVTVLNCDCEPATIDPLPDLCNDDDMINLDDYLNTNLDGSWTSTCGCLTGSMFDASGLTSGQYDVTFVFDPVPTGDCPPDISSSLIVRRQPNVVVNEQGTPCNAPTNGMITTVNLNDLITTNNDVTTGTWTQLTGPETKDISDPTSVEFIGGMAGDTYTFMYMTNSATDPCQDVSEVVTVVVQDCECPIIGSTPPPSPLCNSGGTVDLETLEIMDIATGTWTVSGPGGNVILGGPNGKVLDITGQPAGTYTLTYTLDVTPPSDCDAFTTQTLEVIEQPFATLDTDKEVCNVDNGNGDTFVDFNALVTSGDMTGTWADTDMSGVDLVTDITNVSFINITPGTYTFTYTVSATAPCADVPLTIEITIQDCSCPLIELGLIPEFCDNEGTIDLTPYGDTDPAGTWQSDEITITGNMVDLSTLAEGNYNIYFLLDAPDPGCPDRDNAILTVFEERNAGVPAAPAQFCEGESETVALEGLLSGHDPGGTWVESSGTGTTGFNPGLGTFDITGQPVGTYTFDYAFTGQAPCPDVSSTVVVVIEPVPSAEAGTGGTLDCVTTSVNLDGSNSTSGATIEYSWTDEDGTEVGTDPTLSVTVGGIYTLTVFDNVTGCTSSDDVEVILDSSLPSVDVSGADVSCFGQDDGSIAFSNPTGGSGNYEYSIDNGATWSTSMVFNNLQPGVYDLLMRDDTGCQFPETVTITEPDFFSVNVGEDVDIVVGDQISYSIAGQILQAPAQSIVWTANGVVICEGLECETITDQPGVGMTYCVSVVDANGCLAEDCARVNTETIRDVTIPNVFSPNGQGDNNFFYVTSQDVERIEKMAIYDRWGELVFNLEDFLPNDPQLGWDGTFKDQLVNPGVFVYYIKVFYTNGDDEVFTGDITVVQ